MAPLAGLVQSFAEALRAADPLELTAVVFGLVSVYLSAREHIVSWPTAIVNVAIFAVLFWRAKLYADAALQLVYLALSVYGWYEWLFGGAQHSRLQVSRASRRQWLIVLPLFLFGGLLLGALLDRYTDSPVPYFDALLTSASLVAQWMMTRKLLENWLIWIAADLVYVPLFIQRGLPLTAVQYAVFLLLAALGWHGWRQSLRGQAGVSA
ncbi:MAG: nicotinamide mononucleotide transporter [Gemmatimonadetes bacterium]|nr:nicotinamide mononucleotide transporter [Gemmatimonadota bacterium]